MSEDVTRCTAAGDDVVSDEALNKAEEFIEARGGRGQQAARAGSPRFVTAVAVVMSLFHLYTAYAIVPPQTLRPIHVGFVLFLCFLMFPVAHALPPPHHVVGLARRGARRRRHRLPDRGRRRFLRPQHLAERLGHRLRRRADPADPGGDAPHHRLDHAVRSRSCFLAYALFGDVPAGALDAQGLRSRRAWSATCT